VRKVGNLLPSCAVVAKSGNLNFLEPSGPLQAFTFYLDNLIGIFHRVNLSGRTRVLDSTQPLTEMSNG